MQQQVLELQEELTPVARQGTRLFNRAGEMLRSLELPDTRENIEDAGRELL